MLHANVGLSEAKKNVAIVKIISEKFRKAKSNHIGTKKWEERTKQEEHFQHKG